MTSGIVYIYPAASDQSHTDYALRFIQSYHDNPPGYDHETIVVLNGARRSSEITCMFSSLRNLRFVEHDDSGWDIGGYQAAAAVASCDILVFLGGSTYIKAPAWMKRVVESVQRRGRALYGTMGNQGNVPVGVYPHIRTTGFWMPRELFNAYPIKVRRKEDRYPFEHGPNCLTKWVTKQGLKAYVVTRFAEYEQRQWNDDPNGFHRGNQSAMLFGDRLTCPPFFPTP